jgi:hypothetical protein
MPAEIVSAVGLDAGIPVYDGMASESSPFASLAALLDGRESIERNRQLILQAVLVSTVG